MMGWFKDLVMGTPKVMDNIFDNEKGLLVQVGRFIGNQQYTEQEKQEDQKELSKAVQAYAVATMGENTERSKTRRDIAVMWFKMQRQLIYLQVFCFFTDKGYYMTYQIDLGLSGGFSEIAFNQSIWAITSGIGLFFWGSHALRSSKWSKE